MAKFPESEMSPDKCRTLHRESGEGAIAVREEIGLAPEVVDWFLFAVGERTGRSRGILAFGH